MNTRQLLSVGIDIGTTTTQVIFSRLELVNRAAVSQVPRYEFIKRDISWQSPVFFTPVDKQGELKEAELEALILAQYRAAGIAPQAVDSGAIIITGESAKTRNARPAVMALSQSLGDFVVASAGPHLESVIADDPLHVVSAFAREPGREAVHDERRTTRRAGRRDDRCPGTVGEDSRGENLVGVARGRQVDRAQFAAGNQHDGTGVGRADAICRAQRGEGGRAAEEADVIALGT